MKDGDTNKYQSRIDQKCPQCFRKDKCMLLPSQGATLCLGPFKDEDDRTKKLEEDWAKEEEAKEKGKRIGGEEISEERANRRISY